MKKIDVYVIKYNNGDVNEWTKEWENSPYFATEKEAGEELLKRADLIVDKDEYVDVHDLKRDFDSSWNWQYTDTYGKTCVQLDNSIEVYVKTTDTNYTVWEKTSDNKPVIHFDGERSFIEKQELCLSDKLIEAIKTE